MRACLSSVVGTLDMDMFTLIQTPTRNFNIWARHGGIWQNIWFLLKAQIQPLIKPLKSNLRLVWLNMLAYVGWLYDFSSSVPICKQKFSAVTVTYLSHGVCETHKVDWGNSCWENQKTIQTNTFIVLRLCGVFKPPADAWQHLHILEVLASMSSAPVTSCPC